MFSFFTVLLFLSCVVRMACIESLEGLEATISGISDEKKSRWEPYRFGIGLTQKGKQWTRLHRYNDFVDLKGKLGAKVDNRHFPGKIFPWRISDRRLKLAVWLRNVLELPSSGTAWDEALIEFLRPTETDIATTSAMAKPTVATSSTTTESTVTREQQIVECDTSEFESALQCIHAQNDVIAMLKAKIDHLNDRLQRSISSLPVGGAELDMQDSSTIVTTAKVTTRTSHEIPPGVLHIMAADCASWIYSLKLDSNINAPKERKFENFMQKSEDIHVTYASRKAFQRVLKTQEHQKALLNATVTFDGKERVVLILTFAGTEEVQDWFANAALPVLWDSRLEELGLGVQSGWYALISNRSQSADLGKAIKTLNPDVVLVTGHSLGGALAQIVALAIKFLILPNIQKDETPVYCFTFAAPMPFVPMPDETLTQTQRKHKLDVINWFNKSGHVLNLINNNDLVPRLPLYVEFLEKLGPVPYQLRDQAPLVEQYLSLSRVAKIGHTLVGNSQPFTRTIPLEMVTKDSDWMETLQEDPNNPPGTATLFSVYFASSVYDLFTKNHLCHVCKEHSWWFGPLGLFILLLLYIALSFIPHVIYRLMDQAIDTYFGADNKLYKFALPVALSSYGLLYVLRGEDPWKDMGKDEVAEMCGNDWKVFSHYFFSISLWLELGLRWILTCAWWDIIGVGFANYLEVLEGQWQWQSQLVIHVAIPFVLWMDDFRLAFTWRSTLFISYTLVIMNMPISILCEIVSLLVSYMLSGSAIRIDALMDHKMPAYICYLEEAYALLNNITIKECIKQEIAKLESTPVAVSGTFLHFPAWR